MTLQSRSLKRHCVTVKLDAEIDIGNIDDKVRDALEQEDEAEDLPEIEDVEAETGNHKNIINIL